MVTNSLTPEKPTNVTDSDSANLYIIKVVDATSEDSVDNGFVDKLPSAFPSVGPGAIPSSQPSASAKPSNFVLGSISGTVLMNIKVITAAALARIGGVLVRWQQRYRSGGSTS